MLPVHRKPRKEEKMGSLEKKLRSVAMLGEGDGVVPAATGTRGNWGLPHPDRGVVCSSVFSSDATGTAWTAQRASPQTAQQETLGPSVFGIVGMDSI